MIRKLDITDAPKYISHLARVYDTKGLMSVKDDEWVEEQRNTHVTPENISALLSSTPVSIWGQFDETGNIVKSMRAELATHQPIARLINFKSESKTPFNPVRSLLPMLDIALAYYEKQEVYTFFLLRRLDWFSFRRNTFWEDHSPLDRYNSYYDEIIEAGQESKHALYQLLAGKITYPVKTAIVQMCLKQEYRTFGPNAEVHLPITKEMALMQADKDRTVCVIGVTEHKVGEALCDAFAGTGSTIVPIGREVDFRATGWEESLSSKLPDETKPLVIILNLFDHAPGYGFIQEQIFDFLWAKYKLMPNVQIVAIGSMAHYHILEGITKEYTDSKRKLRDKVVGTGRLGTYRCKLLFIEPGVIESLFIDQPLTWQTMYFYTEEFANRVLIEVNANDRFSFIMANGKHLYTPKEK